MTDLTIAEVEKQLAQFKSDVASGKIQLRKGPRGPAVQYSHEVPDYRPNAKRHDMLSTAFKLIEHDRHNVLKYSALCPRCGEGIIEVLTVFRHGFAEWPPESSIPELCEECEGKLDAMYD